MLLAPAKVYRPPVYHQLRSGETLQIFLAGPIQDAPDWQAEFIEKLSYRLGPHVVIFSPRNIGEMPSYDRQVSWERKHLKQVQDSFRGIMVFWLPRSLPMMDADIEKARLTGERPRPYAQTTRIELGEVCGLMRVRQIKAKVLLGMESRFPNERYIRKLWEEVGKFPIYQNLNDLCEALIKNAK